MTDVNFAEPGGNPYSAGAFRRRVLQRFSSRADLLAAIGGDHVLNPFYSQTVQTGTFKPAAVLIAVIDQDDEARVILTQRTENLSSHKGQIAFPGGKIDDGETPEQAALREAEEEIGLTRQHVELLGTFGTYYSGSGYAIAPVVAMVHGAPELTINTNEVAFAFDVPLAFLMDQASHQVESRVWEKKERFFYAMSYLDANASPPVEHRIWGVTAGIIRMVQERLYGAVTQ